jgi:hypothetical protein
MAEIFIFSGLAFLLLVLIRLELILVQFVIAKEVH